MSKFPNIVILTGAGISAESGLETFRGSDGTWNKYKVEDVATPEAFARSPRIVNEFYNQRRREALKALPNEAHYALAELEKNCPHTFLLITQNVDNLHEKAGSKNLYHMHGTLNHVLCLSCHKKSIWESDVTADSICPHCHAKAELRPDIVWFGEMPFHMEEIEKALSKVDIFVAIGTSGLVYPAAGFVSLARAAGAKCVEINLVANPHSYSLFDEVIAGPATKTVPTFVKKLIEKY
ncbi:NAD-dependent deacylase [uncultured Bartonella sp.]|uniref:NAD-dependent deacylase n=1 Tax=uncultured Bartonella sp. TaxID=104108 RepID=UPI002610FBF9|nr:NAD-dependent deacylase [uncultured Bartonella sp.]